MSSDSDSDSVNITDSDHSFEEDSIEKHTLFTENVVESLCVLSYVHRHNPTDVVTGDLIHLIKALAPDLPLNSLKDISDLLNDDNHARHASANIVHYCSECFQSFPADSPEKNIHVPNN